jgi:Fe-S oxidoreductase
MPQLELGDLDAVERLKDANLPLLAALVDDGWDLMAPIPSCVLMFKQEIPLLFPQDPQVAAVRRAFFDPFEYLMHRHAAGLLRTAFARPLGRIAYHAPCHQRVQNIGPRTRDVLALVPGTEVELIERCSGHDGTYGLREETHARARRLARPVVERIARSGAGVVSSDCPMAGAHLAAGLAGRAQPRHPISLLREAYGI